MEDNLKSYFTKKLSKSASYKNSRKQQNQISSHFHSAMSQVESKCETVLTGFDWNGKWVSYIPVFRTLINLSD